MDFRQYPDDLACRILSVTRSPGERAGRPAAARLCGGSLCSGRSADSVNQRGQTMSVDKAYNFRGIDDLVSTSGSLTEDQLRLLKPEGYEAVINLLPADSDYAIANEPAIVREQGIAYESIPVDFAAPTEANYRDFAARFKALSGKKVMLHCAANYRVSAFYAIFAHEHLGWSIDEARAHIASIWSIEDYPVWETFIESLLGVRSD